MVGRRDTREDEPPVRPQGQHMAAKMQTIRDLMVTGLTYVLDFEQKVSAEAGKMAKAAINAEAKQIFEKSESKGQQYAERLEQVFGLIGEEVKTNTNEIARAMSTEVENMISNTDAGAVRDAALIMAANQMQHYRVAVYGSMETYARLIGKQDAVELFTQSMEDSKGGDATPTKIAEETVDPQAAECDAERVGAGVL